VKRRRHSDEEAESPNVVRSEEELRVETTRHEVGRVRARKVIESEHITQVVPRAVEHADVERVAPQPGDSGQVETFPDGSMSVPVFEERLVVQKQLVVIERVIIRKQRTTEEHQIEADLRRERVEIDIDPEIADRTSDDSATTTRPVSER
jgi:uncharacterized protein (TIGR02271 family)